LSFDTVHSACYGMDGSFAAQKNGCGSVFAAAAFVFGNMRKDRDPFTMQSIECRTLFPPAAQTGPASVPPRMPAQKIR